MGMVFQKSLGSWGSRARSLKGAVPGVVYGADTAVWSHISHPQRNKQTKKGISKSDNTKGIK